MFVTVKVTYPLLFVVLASVAPFVHPTAGPIGVLRPGVVNEAFEPPQPLFTFK